MVKKKPSKYIFLSSTISDLKKERTFIKRFVESYDIVSITCLLSEAPDFPVYPPSLSKNTYNICIDNLLKCDYVIQVLNQKYGIPDIEDKGEFISIVHKEYRKSFRKRLPIFTLVHRKLWNAYNACKRGKYQSYVDDTQLKIFDLLEEIQGHPRKKWIFRYKTLSDIKTILINNLFTFDDSTFMDDVTIPNGAKVQVNEKFKKIWKIKNNGLIVWKNRFLKEENPGCGLTPENSLIHIPETQPADSVQIEVVFVAPKYPATCESYWKMADESGKYIFPWKKGIWCRVKVVY